MTILDECCHTSKYHHIYFVEFCEWIARVAFNLYDKIKQKNSFEVEQVDVTHDSNIDTNSNAKELVNDNKINRFNPCNLNSKRHE